MSIVHNQYIPNKVVQRVRAPFLQRTNEKLFFVNRMNRSLLRERSLRVSCTATSPSLTSNPPKGSFGDTALKAPYPVLVTHEAEILLKARNALEKEVNISLDLGLNLIDATLQEDGVQLPDVEAILSWSDVEEVAENPNGCFAVHQDATLHRIKVFSEGTSRAVSLMPSGVRIPPTALVAGFPMHRFGKGVDPREDTRRKLGAVGRMREGARLLDICTGLGYTAISAAAGGRNTVTTIELDPAMQQMCRMNPWSQGLFHSGITQLIGNASDLVQEFPDNSFDRIIHDPPTFSLAGDLYSKDFYSELCRILTPQGRLYHYIGDPDSRAAGQHFQGILTRLQEAGFEGAAKDFDAHGVVAAHKPIFSKKRGKKPKAKAVKVPRNKSSRQGGGKASKHKNLARMIYDEDFE